MNERTPGAHATPPEKQNSNISKGKASPPIRPLLVPFGNGVMTLPHQSCNESFSFAIFRESQSPLLQGTRTAAPSHAPGPFPGPKKSGHSGALHSRPYRAPTGATARARIAGRGRSNKKYIVQLKFSLKMRSKPTQLEFAAYLCRFSVAPHRFHLREVPQAELHSRRPFVRSGEVTPVGAHKELKTHRTRRPPRSHHYFYSWAGFTKKIGNACDYDRVVSHDVGWGWGGSGRWGEGGCL